MTDGDKMTPPGTAGCVCFFNRQCVVPNRKEI